MAAVWGLMNSWDVAQMLSYVRLCGSLDCSPSGSSVCGIRQARILEWVAISFSRGSEIDLSACNFFLPGEFRE